MKQRFLSFVLLIIYLFLPLKIQAQARRYKDMYGYKLCRDPAFKCLIVGEDVIETEILTRDGIKTIRRSLVQSWESLFSDAAERELMMKINRLNIQLKKGMPIAAPKNMAGKTLLDFSPFQREIKAPKEKILIFDPKLLAWAAYAANGRLARWGPGVGGKNYCQDIQRRCLTLVGEFKIRIKGDAASRSRKYPLGCRGKKCAPMAWYMSFHPAGYAFHGSLKVRGKHSSHGCVRLFDDDAKWLNQSFAEVGTKVIIRPY